MPSLICQRVATGIDRFRSLHLPKNASTFPICSLGPENTFPSIRDVDVQPEMFIEDVEADQLKNDSSGPSGNGGNG